MESPRVAQRFPRQVTRETGSPHDFRGEPHPRKTGTQFHRVPRRSPREPCRKFGSSTWTFPRASSRPFGSRMDPDWQGSGLRLYPRWQRRLPPQTRVLHGTVTRLRKMSLGVPRRRSRKPSRRRVGWSGGLRRLVAGGRVFRQGERPPAEVPSVQRPALRKRLSAFGWSFLPRLVRQRTAPDGYLGPNGQVALAESREKGQS